MKKYIGLLVLYYFRFWARLKLFIIKPTIVGITGTAGKSSARNALYHILKTNGFKKVKASFKANSESGIPLNILGLSIKNYSLFEWIKLFLLAPFYVFLDKDFNIYIAEMGIDSPDWPKNMEYLLSILKPKVGIFLNVGLVHSENFDKYSKQKSSVLDLIAKEKVKLIQALPKDGLAVLNIKDKTIKKMYKDLDLSCKTLLVGKHADVKKIDYDFKNFTTTFEFVIFEKNYLLTINKLLPSYYADTLLSAILASTYFKISIKDAISSLRTLNLPLSRSTIFEGINKSYILDSSYNSSKKALIGFLDMLKKDNVHKRKILALGDMREIGKNSEKEHKQVAEAIIDLNPDLVFLSGPLMSKFVYPILFDKGINVVFKNNAWEIAKALKSEVKTNDFIFIKASQNTLFFEIIVIELLANKKDIKYVCRQTKFYEKKRQKLKDQA